MEAMAKNIDRLVTTLMCEGGCSDRWIIPPLYEAASSKLGGKPISLVAAQRLIERVKSGDKALYSIIQSNVELRWVLETFKNNLY